MLGSQRNWSSRTDFRAAPAWAMALFTEYAFSHGLALSSPAAPRSSMRAACGSTGSPTSASRTRRGGGLWACRTGQPGAGDVYAAEHRFLGLARRFQQPRQALQAEIGPRDAEQHLLARLVGVAR